MTNDRAASGRTDPVLLALAVASVAALGAWVVPSRAADSPYPFEGTWVRANRQCTAAAPLARTYSAREVTGATSHCAVRKVATGSGQFEIFEDCRRGERPGTFTETIRMMGPDAMVVRRQAARLKIARPLRYIRCSIAAAGAPKPPAPHRAAGAGEPAAHTADDHPPTTEPAKP